MFNKIKSLFSKKESPKPYYLEVYYRTGRLWGMVENLYTPAHTPICYILQDESDLPVLIEGILGAARTSTTDKDIRKLYQNLKSEDADVLIYRQKDNIYYQGFKTTGALAISILNRRKPEEYTPKLIKNTAMYRAHLELNAFHKYLLNLVSVPPEALTFEEPFRKIVYDQHVVDYVIKLEALGDSPEAFQALLEKDEDTIDLFFKPLRDINQYLLEEWQKSEDENIPNSVYADHNEFESIFRWSSTTIYPVEPPIY